MRSARTPATPSSTTSRSKASPPSFGSSSLSPLFPQAIADRDSSLRSFITAGSPATLPEFEAALFPPFQAILQQDVSEFSPFVFQILSQLLELHAPHDFPDAYKALLPPLLTPTLWEQKGNIPALVRLLRAFLSRGAVAIVEANQLPPMLGVFQHLIASKANDSFGFELLEALFEYVPLCVFPPSILCFEARLMGWGTQACAQAVHVQPRLCPPPYSPSREQDGQVLQRAHSVHLLRRGDREGGTRSGWSDCHARQLPTATWVSCAPGSFRGTS